MSEELSRARFAAEKQKNKQLKRQYWAIPIGG